MRRGRVVLALLSAAAAAAALTLLLPYKGFDADAYIDIASGTKTTEVARLLAEGGVVRSRWDFLAVRVLRPRAKLQAGEYLFRQPASAWQTFRRLASGDVFYYELTVPEGKNIFDIAAAVDKLGTIRGDDFLAAARGATLIRDLAPGAVTLEGYLFPDTYRITRHTTATELCGLMTGRFRQVWKSISADQQVHPVVTLASLLEKETARDEERPIVASALQNRLRLGMPLDCDPTAIYAALLEHRYYGGLSRSDLDSKNPYNTYQNAGLPPGPIANPGLSSLKAALNPDKTDFIYFVARPDGSGLHTFSRELEAHNRAVDKYRRANLKRNQAGAPKSVPRR